MSEGANLGVGVGMQGHTTLCMKHGLGDSLVQRSDSMK